MLVRTVFLRVMAAAVLTNMCFTQKTDHHQYRRRIDRSSKYPLQVHHLHRDRVQKKTPRTAPNGVWSGWGAWTACSRSCGGGVTQQTRHCVTRPADPRFSRRQRRRRQIGGCVGLYKRIRLCNNHECPEGRDFRFEQCAAFNNRFFKGKLYFWQPFHIDSDECSLNCRPIGLNFYATLNKTVIDGTSCQHPMTVAGRKAPKGTKGVCIDGYCKSVNANGIVGSVDSTQEECAACRKGPCRSVNGLYTRSDLPVGYSPVAQIPPGACAVLVQQLKHSRNLIALKNANGSFIINGDWKFSNSRTVEAANTKFTYTRQDQAMLETVAAPGPLANAIDIMIVNYQTNPGIKYSYALPVDQQESRPMVAPPLLKRPAPASPEPRRLDVSTQRDEAARTGAPHRRTRARRRFTWKVSGVSACSRSCGGGVQAAVVTCVREHGQTPAPERRCAHLERPAMQPIRCNADACPPRWEGAWGPCSATCGEDAQQQQLEPQCQQEVAAGRSVAVDDSACPQPKPAAQTRPCRLEPCESDNELERPPPPPSRPAASDDWTVGAWSPCSATCGPGRRTRSVVCPSGRCHPEHRPKHVDHCDSGPCSRPEASPWMATSWSDCSVACGTGIQTRIVVCPQSSCPEHSRPEAARACSSERECGGQWFAGPWSTCTDACGAPAKQKRDVLCVVKIRGQAHVTNDKTCPTNTRPDTEQPCEGRCSAHHWYTGEWANCENCPNGIQKREVRCLDHHGRRVSVCDESEMPVARRTCSCRKEEQKYRPAQDEPADRSCADRIRNCYLAVQARLCQYPYYTTHCCVSCKRAQQDLLE